MRTATLLLVGQDTLTRMGLKSLFTGSSFAVVGEASEPGAIDARLLTEPAIVLLEGRGTPTDIRDALLRLKAIYPDTPAVVLSEKAGLTYLRACFGAGAAGFLTMDISRDALLHSLELAMLGELVFPTELAELLMHAPPPRQSPRVAGEKIGGLSDREVETVQCLIRGDSNKLIASHLRITEATIKVHVKSLMRKINAKNRTQAAIWAHSHGLLPPDAAAHTIDGARPVGQR